jgi:hypothetical protein
MSDQHSSKSQHRVQIHRSNNLRRKLHSYPPNHPRWATRPNKLLLQPPRTANKMVSDHFWNQTIQTRPHQLRSYKMGMKTIVTMPQAHRMQQTIQTVHQSRHELLQAVCKIATQFDPSLSMLRFIVSAWMLRQRSVLALRVTFQENKNDNRLRKKHLSAHGMTSVVV